MSKTDDRVADNKRYKITWELLSRHCSEGYHYKSLCKLRGSSKFNLCSEKTCPLIKNLEKCDDPR